MHEYLLACARIYSCGRHDIIYVWTGYDCYDFELLLSFYFIALAQKLAEIWAREKWSFFLHYCVSNRKISGRVTLRQFFLRGSAFYTLRRLIELFVLSLRIKSWIWATFQFLNFWSGSKTDGDMSPWNPGEFSPSLIDWMIDWLVGRLIDQSTYWLIDWLID